MHTLRLSSRLQQGSSSLENTIAMLVFLLLCLAFYESAHWLLMRQALNGALLDTARVAVTQRAHPTIIQEAFVQALQARPAFAFKTTTTDWRIDYYRWTPTSTPTQHSYQALQYQNGHIQVFDENTLELKLHYAHRPHSPLIRYVLAQVLAAVPSTYRPLFATGRLPIVTTIQLAMQSDGLDSTQGFSGSVYTPSYSPEHTAPPALTTTPPVVTPTGPAPLNPWQPAPAPPISSCDPDSCCGPET